MPALKQTATFQKWRRRIKDGRAKALIASRLDRMAFGHAGDTKAIGDGVIELRVHYGPGYRIYFLQRDNEIVLLCGGSKGTQAKDIETAKKLASKYRRRIDG